MIHITDLQDILITGQTAVTVGKFDGLHLGHQLLIRAVKEEAASRGLKTVLLALSPDRVNGEDGCRTILSRRERMCLLEKFGLDYFIEVPLTERLRRMSPEDFARKLLIERLHAAYIAVGEDFCFGYQRRGTPGLLKELSGREQYGYRVDTFPKVRYRDAEISSTRIRSAIAAGAMEDAAAMLGTPYTIEGEIIHGKALGRTIGFPTINLHPAPEKLLPPDGVYFAEILLEGESLTGIGNLGMQPTVSGTRRRLEIHILDFDRTVYGQSASVKLMHFSRPERTFASLDELRITLEADRQKCRSFFSGNSGHSCRVNRSACS